MHTQTVQNSPLLSGNTASGRPSSAAQEDQQFAQALNHQIERQALPPMPQPQANAAPRRAEAPKPAAPQAQASAPAPASQQPKPASSTAPANNASAPAKAQQDKQPESTAQPTDAQGNAAPGGASAAGSKGAPDGKTADGTGQTDEQKAAGDAAADMLAMLQGLAPPVASDAAAAAAASAAAASSKTGRAADAAALAGDAVLDGKGGKAGSAPRLPADDTVVDQTTLLAAKSAAAGAASGQASASEQDPALGDAMSKLQGHAADATGTDKAQPRADFQAALQQASTDASKGASAAELDAKRAIQPQAGALQAAATALAPAGAANAQAAQALAGNALHARVGSQGWDQQLGQKVVWMANGGEQSATLTLNPPDLGPLQVVLSVSNDQASVAFTAAQPEVRAALEQALPKLRETMGDAGIMLGDASVSSGSQDQQQAFAGMAAGSRGRGAANGQSGNSDEGDAAARPAPQVRRSVLSAVDTFA